MKYELTDEKLTAYVLGEIDEAGRKAIEKLLETDEAARQTVSELRATAAIATEAFQTEAVPSLSDNQRQSVRKMAEKAPDEAIEEPVRKKKRFFGVPTGMWVAAAAMLVVGVSSAILLPNLARVRESSSRMLAKGEEQALMDSSAQRSLAAVEAGERLVADQSSAQNMLVPQREASRYVVYDDMAKKEEPKARVVTIGQAATVDKLSALGYLGDGDSVASPSAPQSAGAARIYYGGNERPNLPEVSPASTGKPGRVAQSSSEPAVFNDGGYTLRVDGLNSVPPTKRPEQSSTDPIDDPRLNYWPGHNTEAYDTIVDNAFKDVAENMFSTFSIDVDTASYSNMRRFLTQNSLPPKDSVRIEEMLNYFNYDYEPPKGGKEDAPFASHVEIADCPWNPGHRLARIGLKGWDIPDDERPASNLVFLLDVSGSMRPDNKLPLLKKGIKLLVEKLGENDTVSIVVYASASGLVLPPTTGDNKEVIFDALDRLKSGGSTNGGQGIQLAYDTAVGNFIKGGVNRVILATDGDFNVGITNRGDLTRMIEQKAKTGVFLTVLGFGMGNVKDATLEELSGKGNGNYAYIDTLKEARKVMVEEMGGTLITIAKDVKIQIEFNPLEVAAYRLIGYENRILAKEDFNDDKKDAGEIGAGHTVTALYELVPAGTEIDLPDVDESRYQRPTRVTKDAKSGEMFLLKLRYKQPDGETSRLLQFPIKDKGKSYANASRDFKFASAVASFGMLLRDSEHKGNSTFDSVLELAEEGIGGDEYGYRHEFVELVRKAKSLKR